ncbi:CDP-paratose 2-epimerase [Candidatus Roizmanbacteria bacterium RIFCSPLOWO2_02_FULL_38_10]|uniref:CDP-paratose 2-epimerase n=1 Tax=Candidatus Roizmanbacteria bacterium RIFCSPLOWO2_02_FULL_38_10 TaxID=1802074 RepID=A0A1F7JL48_9BACT|nr:MAG: CDP-paratose 2-epimerase [Candidatus Roizmanbacteria bacterium RIFCSPLOWO2_02_FULL_38_10]
MRVLITGGAGFIGINLAANLLKQKHQVHIFDNLSRTGTNYNLEWLKQNQPKFEFTKGDIRNYEKIKPQIEKADVVYHLAAQVAVTTSVVNPREDFEINLLGSFNILEAIRNSKNKPILLYASTNKVYGDLGDVKITETKSAYKFKDLTQGISETQPLDFHSPYGCSKGAADEYIHDYSRIYGIKTIIFRQSCIYGQHQFGIEDQGWLAWFTIAVLLNKPITIYGNGKQTRDVLHVDDLVRAYGAAINHINKTKGQIYNIGGGKSNAISVYHEFVPMLKNILKQNISVKFGPTRPGDQLIFVSDNRKAKADFKWQPKISKEDGIKKLIRWISANKQLIRKVF